MAIVHSLDVHCDQNLKYACKVEEDLKIHEPTVINFIDSDAWINTAHFEMGKGCNVTVLPSGIFQRFQKLTTIDIVTGLKSIQSENFKDAIELQHLTLNNNQIHVIPSNVFREAANLERIELSNNRIISIEDLAFNGLSTLRHIQLHNNSITILKRNTFSGAPKIKTIRLENNLIETIEDGAFALQNLKFLMLSFNRLQTLSNNVFAMAPILEKIALRSNNLQAIGQSFNNLNKLKELDLSTNQINDINLATFARLKRLKRLLLSNSGFQFKSTDEAINSGSVLATLDISENNLSESNVLARLEPLAKLRNLNLKKNRFSDLIGIDDIGVKYTRLTDFAIGGNRFTCEKRKEILDSVQKQDLDIINYDAEDEPINVKC